MKLKQKSEEKKKKLKLFFLRTPKEQSKHQQRKKTTIIIMNNERPNRFCERVCVGVKAESHLHWLQSQLSCLYLYSVVTANESLIRIFFHSLQQHIMWIGREKYIDYSKLPGCWWFSLLFPHRFTLKFYWTYSLYRLFFECIDFTQLFSVLWFLFFLLNLCSIHWTMFIYSANRFMNLKLNHQTHWIIDVMGGCIRNC